MVWLLATVVWVLLLVVGTVVWNHATADANVFVEDGFEFSICKECNYYSSNLEQYHNHAHRHIILILRRFIIINIRETQLSNIHEAILGN